MALVKSCAEARLYIDGSLRTNHFCKDDENEGTVSFVDLSEASWIEEANYNDKKAFLDCQVFTIENYLMISTKSAIPCIEVQLIHFKDPVCGQEARGQCVVLSEIRAGRPLGHRFRLGGSGS